jgi:hypothetical protein
VSHLLQPHPTLEQQHQAGVAQLKSNPEHAEKLLHNALWSIEGFYLNNRKLAGEVHTGRILRDLGNASLRRAVNTLTRDSQHAQSLLEDSTTYLTNSAVILQRIADQTPALPEKAQSYAMAQYGATVSLQARQQTAELIAFDNEDAAPPARSFFRQAKDLLQRGNNSYFSTSNALNAARFESFEDHNLAAAAWTLRGSMALAHSLTTDRRNALPSMHTFGRLTKDIISGKSAIRHAVLAGGV